MSRAFLHFIALAILLPASLCSGDDAKMQKMLADPKLAEGMAKVVGQMRKGEGCKTTFRGCIKGCSGGDKEGCIMECQTDCSVCAYEEAGLLNASMCEP